MVAMPVGRSTGPVSAEFDAVRAAVDDGSIGAAHVDLFARSARDLGPDLQQHLNDPDLVAAASAEPVDVFARRIRRTVDLIRGDDGLADSQSKRDASSWKSWIDERTGMGHVHGKFDPERFEAICGAVERQVSRLANEGGVTKSHGLAAQAAFGLLTGSTSTSAGSAAPHIGVLVDWETFTRGAHPDSVRETAAGRPVPPQTIARLACDAVVQRIVLDERGVPINVGRRHRTATAAQWIAIRAVYRTCAWHGCERPRVRRCLPKANSRRTPKASHLHHVHEWEHGGETDLCNLIPLCGEHHHAVHEGGWSLHLHDDRRLDIYMPDGRHHATTDPDRCPDMMEPPEPLSRPPVAANRSRRMVAAVRGGGRE